MKVELRLCARVKSCHPNGQRVSWKVVNLGADFSVAHAVFLADASSYGTTA